MVLRKMCRGECGFTYEGEVVGVMFASGGHSTKTAKTRTICRRCRQTARDRKKVAGRFREKARKTRLRHARKFGKSTAELRDIFGWNVNLMAHEIEHNFSNGCACCSRSYSTMPNGLRDVTLDIKAPDGPPMYGANTQWICTTCNIGKSKMGPAKHALVVQGFRQCERFMKEKYGFGQGRLFAS